MSNDISSSNVLLSWTQTKSLNHTANLGFKWNYPIPPFANKLNIGIKDNYKRKLSKHFQKMFQSRQTWWDWKTQTVFEEQRQRQKKQMMRSPEAPTIDLSKSIRSNIQRIFLQVVIFFCKELNQQQRLLMHSCLAHNIGRSTRFLLKNTTGYCGNWKYVMIII